MITRILLPTVLALAISGAAHAGGSTIVGGALGGGVGAAVGEYVGGRDGAIIGGALGGGVGAAAGYDYGEERPRYVRERRHRHHHHYREWDDDRRGRGYFCPPGQAKKGRC
ncbi:hypothetical protein GSY71_14970 [Pusillimonas sp. TS35]|nr:hypothetical protein [Pusillimonas sp. TS35]